MLHHEASARYMSIEQAVDNAATYLRGEIVGHPYVMITFEPYYLHAFVGETGKRTKKSCISARHHIAVFKPVVDYVAEQVKSRGIGGN